MERASLDTGRPEKEHEYRLVDGTLNRFAKGSAPSSRAQCRERARPEARPSCRLVVGPGNPKEGGCRIDLPHRGSDTAGDGDELEISVRAIADKTRCSLPTARHYAEELGVLQIAEYATGSQGTPGWWDVYVLAPEFRELAK